MAFPITIVYCDDLREEVIFSPADIPMRKAFTVIDTYDREEYELVTITHESWENLPEVLPDGTLIYLPGLKRWSKPHEYTGRRIKDESPTLWHGTILRIPK